MGTKLRFLLIFSALVAALFLMMAIAYASPGVSLVKYPNNVTYLVPANDDSQGRPFYRANMQNSSNAPFAVVLKIVGHNNQQGYFWLTDDQPGNTVQTYNRFAPNANKGLPSGYWLNESDSRPDDLVSVTITADVFYVMVIGRIPVTVNAQTITYTVKYEIGGTSGSRSFASNVVTDCVDWYLNWDDSNEKGDPAFGADFVELFDNNLNSFTTAPIDEDKNGEGYFEVLLPKDANGQTWFAEARTESLNSVRAWVTTISSTLGTCDELINARTGGPTKVGLVRLGAGVAPNPLAMVVIVVLVVLTVALFFAYRGNHRF